MSRKLIMFGARWCKPCRRGKQLLEQFSKDTGAETEYIDCEQKHDIASRYGIQHVPTFVLEESGIETARIRGLSVSYFYEIVRKEET